MSLVKGMLSYIKGLKKRSIHFENESLLQSFLEQMTECQELIEDTNKQIKEAQKSEKGSLKEYLQFYEEEKTSLKESKFNFRIW